jgi:DNA-binding XRE family transcriptional regulator
VPNQPFASVVVGVTLSVAVDIDWHIGDVIAKLRKKHRMNQTALAAKVGVNKATIVRAEDGDPKVSRATYMNIARVLGIDLAALEVEASRLESGRPSSEPPLAAAKPDKRDNALNAGITAHMAAHGRPIATPTKATKSSGNNPRSNVVPARTNVGFKKGAR